MSKIEEKCKAKGVRLTDQRRLVAKVMSNSTDHPDVDELHKRVIKIDKKISIATVYRTVKLFEESGIIDKQSLDVHHDHLIDISTGEILDFVDDEIE